MGGEKWDGVGWDEKRRGGGKMMIWGWDGIGRCGVVWCGIGSAWWDGMAWNNIGGDHLRVSVQCRVPAAGLAADSAYLTLPHAGGVLA